MDNNSDGSTIEKAKATNVSDDSKTALETCQEQEHMEEQEQQQEKEASPHISADAGTVENGDAYEEAKEESLAEEKEEHQPEEEEMKNDVKDEESIKKPAKRRRNRVNKVYAVTKCPHTDQKYYAKGMCKNCYHHFGRPFLATGCEHTTRMNFAKKMCIACYHKNKKKSWN